VGIAHKNFGHATTLLPKTEHKTAELKGKMARRQGGKMAIGLSIGDCLWIVDWRLLIGD